MHKKRGIDRTSVKWVNKKEIRASKKVKTSKRKVKKIKLKSKIKHKSPKKVVNKNKKNVGIKKNRKARIEKIKNKRNIKIGKSKKVGMQVVTNAENKKVEKNEDRVKASKKVGANKVKEVGNEMFKRKEEKNIEKSKKVRVEKVKEVVNRKFKRSKKVESKKSENKDIEKLKLKKVKTKKGWPGEKEKHTIAAKGLKISQYKNRKRLFSFVFILGFLLSLLTFVRNEFFIFHFIGLPLILLSFYGYHYLTKIKESNVFEKKKKFVDYVSLFLFVIFLLFAILFLFMKEWLLMSWGLLLMVLTLLFYVPLARKKYKFKKMLIVLLIFVLVATAIFFLYWYQLLNVGIILNTLSSWFVNLKLLLLNMDLRVGLGLVLAIIIIILVFLIIIEIKKRVKLKNIKDGDKSKKPSKEKISTTKVKLKATKFGETSLDLLYQLIEEKQQIKMDEIINIFSITKEQAKEWANILENQNLVIIEYPLFGSPILKKPKMAKKEDNKEEGDSEK